MNIGNLIRVYISKTVQGCPRTRALRLEAKSMAERQANYPKGYEQNVKQLAVNSEP